MIKDEVKRVVQKWFEARPLLENINYHIDEIGGLIYIEISMATSRGVWRDKFVESVNVLSSSIIPMMDILDHMLLNRVSEFILTCEQPPKRVLV